MESLFQHISIAWCLVVVFLEVSGVKSVLSAHIPHCSVSLCQETFFSLPVWYKVTIFHVLWVRICVVETIIWKKELFSRYFLHVSWLAWILVQSCYCSINHKLFCITNCIWFSLAGLLDKFLSYQKKRVKWISFCAYLVKLSCICTGNKLSVRSSSLFGLVFSLSE